MTTTIGRIVHYKAHGSPDGTHKAVYRTAIITDVESDEWVSLCVLNPSGLFFNQRCKFDDSENPPGGTWKWPPR